MFLRGHLSVSENADHTVGDVLNIYNQQRTHIHCYKSIFIYLFIFKFLLEYS